MLFRLGGTSDQYVDMDGGEYDDADFMFIMKILAIQYIFCVLRVMLVVALIGVI